jgi:hypothetical protein
VATTFKQAFNLQFSQFKAVVTKVFGDGTRANSQIVADLVSKFAPLALSSDTANTTITGADMAVAAIFDVPIGSPGTVTIDLTTLTDLAERTAQAFARLKLGAFMLLPTAKGGNGCAGVTIGNAATNANTLFFGAATDTAPLENGDWILWVKGTAAGKVVDATHKSILVTNADAAIVGKLLTVLIGGSN